MLDKNIFSGFLSDTLKDFDPEKEKVKILSHPLVIQLLSKLKLNEMQINKNMNLLQKYYDYVEDKNEEPRWKIYLDQYGNLVLDFTNGKSFVKQKMLNNFLLTSITPLDADLEAYFRIPDKSKPKKIMQDANNALRHFSPLIYADIKKITDTENKNYSKGLFLVDSNFKSAKAIFQYLAVIFATNKNKTVALLDESSLFNHYYQLLSNPEGQNNLSNLLVQVDYLFIDRFSVFSKPEWYINLLIDILMKREDERRHTFISSLMDITSDSINIIFRHKNANTIGIKRIENLFKNLINRLTIKHIANK
ncbi:hypothetical protein [Metamycoplasma equirhinis]|uniref:hypothetical protein n=1 Tax=Metamycoplasma equirhinis TaxID=92402 RepID=UPI003593A3F5